MAFEVLKNSAENDQARRWLKDRGLDFTSSLFERMLRKVGIIGGVTVGDYRKSWDVLKTVEFIEKNVPVDAKILDFGAYASEILPILHRLGYASLKGVDLNPKIKNMVYGDKIDYSLGNFMKQTYPVKFDAVTAISVIEHGYNEEKLLKVLSAIVKPGGFFIASVDYWPEKIDTSGVKAFGMDWRIFSKEDIANFFESASRSGFHPESMADFKADKPVIKWMGKEYTFAWLVLKKMA